MAEFTPDHYVESVRPVFTIKIDDIDEAKEQSGNGQSIYKKKFSPFRGIDFEIDIRFNNSYFIVSLKNCGQTGITIRSFFSKNLKQGSPDIVFPIEKGKTTKRLVPGSSVQLENYPGSTGKKTKEIIFEITVEFVLPKYRKNIFICLIVP